MPFTEDEPPTTLPRGVTRRRPPRCGSGSETKPQSYRLMFMG